MTRPRRRAVPALEKLVPPSSKRQPFKCTEHGLSRRRELMTTRSVSLRMATIRQRGTLPELVARQTLTQLGLRYTLENRDLPGSPDLANRSKRFAVFVHGCFWHHHSGCMRATTPKTNRGFWRAKFTRNRQRDLLRRIELKKRGYRVIVIWECETRESRVIIRRLRQLRSRAQRGHGRLSSVS